LITMDIEDYIEQFKKYLLKHERTSANELVRAYGKIWQRVQDRLSALDVEYQASKARGEVPNPAWIYEHNRLQSIKDQIERELNNFAKYAESKILAEQKNAIESAGKNAEVLIKKIADTAGLTIDWNRIDKQSVIAILGAIQQDTPLGRLFAGFGAEAAERAGDILVQGMLLGKNPRAIAPELRRALSISLSRALRISRTEILRAQRVATRANYQENSDIVQGWIWHADLDERTCAACWAMHGTKHTLDETLDDHPNGRCAMIPIVKGYDYGIKAGAEKFSEISEDKQIAILGMAKWQAWKDGKLTFDENPQTGIVGRSYNADWGWMRYERSAKNITQG